VEQTGRSFTLRFNEYKNAFETNNHTYNFTKHLIEQTHLFDSIRNAMLILQRQNKWPHYNILERFYIYTEYLKNNHLNDDHTMFPNMTFEALLKPHQS